MQCHQCDEALTPMRAKGKTVLGCKACRSLWVPIRLAQPARTRWVAADHFSALVCPGCEARSLRLGSVGNRPIHRCDACGGDFVQHETGSAFAFAMECFVVGVLGSDFLTCAFS